MIAPIYVGAPVGLVTGFVFGIALEKSRVFLPSLIRAQMQLRNFTMVRMFVAACATSILTVCILIACHVKRVPPKETFWVPDIIGGLSIGTGMVLAGACPGTVLVQMAAGVQWSILTYVGGLVGALAFGYLYPPMKDDLFEEGPGAITIDKEFGVPFWVPPVVVAPFLVLILLGVERYRRWYTEIGGQEGVRFLDMRARAWPPHLAGAIVGLCIVPGYWLVEIACGTSASYVTIAGRLASVFDKSENEYFHQYWHGQSYYQVVFITGIFLGGLVSSLLAGTRHPEAVPVTHPITSFIGGFLLVFGARFARGCPSGNGISGTAEMSVGSWITVPMMFVGGIVVALFFPPVSTQPDTSFIKVPDREPLVGSRGV